MGSGPVVVAGWRWASASCRGVSHERAGTRLQDAAISFVLQSVTSEYFVGIVSDGAGSAPFGGEGASLVCRSISSAIRRHFGASTSLPNQENVDEWIDRARDLISAVAARRQLRPRDFAATFVCLISDGEKTVIAHVGDGCAVIKDDVLNAWVAPIWPFHGEYASTTAFLTDDEGARLQFAVYANAVGALGVFSDGIERLALDFGSKQPFQPFFEGMVRPLLASQAYGRDRELSAQLKTYLDSAAVNARTDDDKSLILAIRK